MKRIMLAILVIAMMGIAVGAQATISVTQFGDNGWYSDDTRSTSGADLRGANYTHAVIANGGGTAADDAVIAQQIQFVNDAPDGTGAVALTFPTGTGVKATISRINTDTGFATGDWTSDFYLNSRRYRTTNTNTTFKLGVQSSNWADSQAGFTATKLGESTWDIGLVFTSNSETKTNEWEDFAFSDETIDWKLSFQSGNTYFTNLYKNANGMAYVSNTHKTLAAWAQDSFWAPILFGDTAKVTNVAISAGSFSQTSTGYIDYIETNLLDNGERNDFGAPVPEPSSLLALAAFVPLAGFAVRRRK